VPKKLTEAQRKRMIKAGTYAKYMRGQKLSAELNKRDKADAKKGTPKKKVPKKPAKKKQAPAKKKAAAKVGAKKKSRLTAGSTARMKKYGL